MSRLGATLCLCAVWLLLGTQRAAALDLIFDYRFDGSGFFDDPAARRVLEEAALRYEEIVDGELTSLVNEEWTAEFSDPSTGERTTLESLDVEGDTLLIFVGARPLSQAGRLALAAPGAWRIACSELEALGSCTLTEELSALLSILGGVPSVAEVVFPFGSWLERVVFRGRASAREFPPTGFAPWGGAISFDEDARWYFGLERDVPPDRIDFLSIVLHELGHVLGIGTAESWGTHTPKAEFEGDGAVAVMGGPVALADDLAHWRDGTRSDADGIPAQAAFTQNIEAGERRSLTELDVAALLDIGWTRRTPLPGTILDATYYLKPLRGDVDADGRVDVSDLRIVERFVGGYPDAFLQSADVVRDGQVDVLDLVRLRKAAMWARDAEDGVLKPPLAILLAPFLQSAAGGPQATNDPLLQSLADDFAAIRLLGWRLASPPAWPPEIVWDAKPLAGDLDADGAIAQADVVLLEEYFGDQLAGSAYAAADVAPMRGGVAIGDGRVDEDDVALLRRATTEPDIDGDGMPTVLENAINALWLVSVGRPRHRPLVSWTDACLDFGDVALDKTQGISIDASVHPKGERAEELVLEFCSRDGSAWSLRPAVSPEEYELELRKLENKLRDRSASDSDSADRPPRSESTLADARQRRGGRVAGRTGGEGARSAGAPGLVPPSGGARDARSSEAELGREGRDVSAGGRAAGSARGAGGFATLAGSDRPLQTEASERASALGGAIRAGDDVADEGALDRFEARSRHAAASVLEAVGAAESGPAAREESERAPRAAARAEPPGGVEAADGSWLGWCAQLAEHARGWLAIWSSLLWDTLAHWISGG